MPAGCDVTVDTDVTLLQTWALKYSATDWETAQTVLVSAGATTGGTTR